MEIPNTVRARVLERLAQEQRERDARVGAAMIRHALYGAPIAAGAYAAGTGLFLLGEMFVMLDLPGPVEWASWRFGLLCFTFTGFVCGLKHGHDTGGAE